MIFCQYFFFLKLRILKILGRWTLYNNCIIFKSKKFVTCKSTGWECCLRGCTSSSDGWLQTLILPSEHHHHHPRHIYCITNKTLWPACFKRSQHDGLLGVDDAGHLWLGLCHHGHLHLLIAYPLHHLGRGTNHLKKEKKKMKFILDGVAAAASLSDAGPADCPQWLHLVLGL